ncbi:DUF6415 family natural product biosynthesis protein [Streptomyces sp. NPDC058678]|uniref:DUF6415 family natural product biosynthesis protein n=1 Tax=Streptomyces sp. NPDC058678 TaxID=3346595 RepID=UPI003657F5BF
MTAPAAISHSHHPAGMWTLLDAPALEAVLARLRQWTPFDGDALLEDIGDVLDDVTPPEEDLPALAGRLDGDLTRLAAIAAACQAGHSDEPVGRLLGQARALVGQGLPAGYRQALGHLRRMAFTAHELSERLDALKCLKEAA